MDSRFNDSSFDELATRFGSIDRTEESLVPLLEQAAFSRLQKIAGSIDWREFKIDADATISGEGCTWLEFCNTAGELGHALASQAYVKAFVKAFAKDDGGKLKVTSDASGDVCWWLSAVETEPEVKRLQRLVKKYRKLPSWQSYWSHQADVSVLQEQLSQHRKSVRRELQKLTSAQRKTISCKDAFGPIAKSQIALHVAVMKSVEHDIWSMRYLMVKLFPAKLHFLPTIDLSLPKPTEADLQSYADQCRQLELELSQLTDTQLTDTRKRQTGKTQHKFDAAAQRAADAYRTAFDTARNNGRTLPSLDKFCIGYAENVVVSATTLAKKLRDNRAQWDPKGIYYSRKKRRRS